MMMHNGKGIAVKSHLMIVLLLISATLIAGGIPKKPNPPRLVNDFADILSPRQEQLLEQKLKAFNDTTSNQIVVVSVQSLNGYDPATFATELGHKWGVGQQKFDNGVVVLIKPKYGNQKGRAFIAVGYGLEPVITDALAKRIVEQEMIPYFKQGNYFNGIDAATTVLMQLASGEINEKIYNEQHRKSWITALLPFIIFFILFLFIRISNARSYSIGHGTSLWTAFWLGSMLSGGAHRGSWNNFSGGGGSGFGGGGSFGGFGGGGFGGGGAGGSW